MDEVWHVFDNTAVFVCQEGQPVTQILILNRQLKVRLHRIVMLLRKRE